MRQTIRFLSRFLIALWVVLVGALLVPLVFNAPNVPQQAPFAGVSILEPGAAPVHLPNRLFTCNETGQEFECRATVQNRPLELVLTKGSGSYIFELSNCRAQFNGRSVTCTDMGMTYAPILTKAFELSNTGLSAQELNQVRQQHWVLDTLTQLGEVRLLWISAGLALVAGASATLFAWLHPGRPMQLFASLVCGFGVYRWLMWDLLGRVPFDWVTPYGIAPEQWSGLVNGLAIAAGIGTAFVIAKLLWQRLNRVAKTLISVSSGIALFHLSQFSVVWHAGYLGSFFGLDFSGGASWATLRLIAMGVAAIVAIATAISLWMRTVPSTRVFVCICGGIGALALATNFFLMMLLDLGYVD